MHSKSGYLHIHITVISDMDKKTHMMFNDVRDVQLGDLKLTVC